MKTEPFVFISYRRTDKDIAYKTRNILIQNKINVWMAPESIPAGSDYASEIPSALELCSAFVLILSKDAQNSKWIPKEIDGAINNGKIIIPFKIDDSVISKTFDFRLCDSQRIEAYQRISDAYLELIDRLKEILHIENNELLPNKEKSSVSPRKNLILQNRKTQINLRTNNAKNIKKKPIKESIGNIIFGIVFVLLAIMLGTVTIIVFVHSSLFEKILLIGITLLFLVIGISIIADEISNLKKKL